MAEPLTPGVVSLLVACGAVVAASLVARVLPTGRHRRQRTDRS